MTTEKDMLDALIQHQVYSYRASTKAVNDLNAEFVTASNSLVSKLRDLLDELTDAEKEALTLGKYTTDNLKEIKTLFDDWYQVVATQLPESFSLSAVALAVYEASYVSKLYGEEITLDGDKIYKSAIKKPIVGGQLFDDVWKNLADSTRNKALYLVREGIQNGLNTAQIANQIRGTKTNINGKNKYVGGIVEDLVGNGLNKKGSIDGAVRTIRSHVSQIAYENTFKALGFDYVKDIVTLDGRTSSTCQGVAARDLIQPIDSITFKPPYHYRCRTVQIGCNKDGKIDGKRPFVADTRSVKNIPKDERNGIIGQVDANVNYPEWFGKQSAVFQKEVLGSTKYNLYKNGGFTFDKFVDPLGKPYTIAELRELDQKTFARLGL